MINQPQHIIEVNHPMSKEQQERSLRIALEDKNQTEWANKNRREWFK